MTVTAECVPVAAKWLSALYGTAETGWVTLFSLDRATGQRTVDWAPVDRLEQLADVAAERAVTSCVWFGVGIRRQQLGEGRRGGDRDVTALPGLWLDVDVAGPGHQSGHRLPVTFADARNLIGKYPVPPTAVTSTGGGFQAFWLFNELVELDDTVRTVLQRWAATWSTYAEELGVHVDNTADPARIMRLPGTRNRKTSAAPYVDIVEWDSGNRYGIQDLDQWLIDPPQPQTDPKRNVPYIGPERPGDAYNARNHATDVLAAAGFTFARTDGNGDTHWTRPGKQIREGTSATVYAEDGHVTVWSDTCHAMWPTMPLRRPMDPFGLHVHTVHGGDFPAATRQLRHDGYGTPPVAADGPPPADDNDPSKFRLGGSFVLDAPEGVPAVWGSGEDVLWASGEPLIIAGPTGVGKTTLVVQVVAGRLGIVDQVLGLPVTPGSRRVLYLAMDRPQQIARAMRRLFTETNRTLLNDRLLIWPGPLTADLGKTPGLLLELALLAEADTVVIDSLKDAAVKLTDDESGGNLNRAIQTAIAAGVEVIGLHHQRKGQGGARPNTLEDVYGSTWITAGAGSVVLLWGAAGDALIDLNHLKQPAGEVGPWRVEHDHTGGRSIVQHGFDVLVFVQSNPRGVTAVDVARAMFGTEVVSDNNNRKARRKLDVLVGKGMVRRDDMGSGGAGGSTANRFFPVDNHENGGGREWV